MGFHQTKMFLHNKGNQQQNEKKLIWQNIFTNDTSDNGLISNIHKELNPTPNKQTIQLKN